DVVIVGAGVAGLSTAFELAQRGAAVRVITAPQRPPAGLAAAGMLAPSVERLSDPLRRLADQSLSLYPDFVDKLQAVSGHHVHYLSRSDFLVPFFEHVSGGDLIHGDAVRLIEPALSPQVVAVRRHPRDASVDNRRLLRALRVACEKLGVTFVEQRVRAIIASHQSTHVAALESDSGTRIHAAHFIIAAGAWTRNLLPMVPIHPVKGQMMSLVPPVSSKPLLNHVLHGSKVYIVPKNDSTEFYVGATVEHCGFDARNTPAGLKRLIDAAIELVPDMAHYEIHEMWTGFRPGTPDASPIFGLCTFDNLSVATGFHRNGILLAPIGAKIAAAYAQGQTADLPPDLRHLLDNFTLDRFYGNATKLAHATLSKNQPSEVATFNINPVTGASDSPKIAEPKNSKDIKLWKLRPDGTSEPVYPPGWEGPMNISPRDLAELIATSEAQVTHTQPAPAPSQLKEASISLQSTDSSTPDSRSAVNDAYDDILSKRGPDMRESMSKSLAENRAFGRQPCSLQRKDGPVLSLTEEDVKRCDAAAEMGYRDMQELEKYFDANHESVIATRTEAEETDTEEINPSIRIGGIELHLQ
ncbi:unnamed protein product, partial [Agarophyton chilense]